jgi:hypothetical protein
MWFAVPLLALLLAAPMSQGHECTVCNKIEKGYTPGESFILFLTAVETQKLFSIFVVQSSTLTKT